MSKTMMIILKPLLVASICFVTACGDGSAKPNTTGRFIRVCDIFLSRYVPILVKQEDPGFRKLYAIF